MDSLRKMVVDAAAINIDNGLNIDKYTGPL